jgi:hypothetical protein
MEPQRLLKSVGWKPIGNSGGPVGPAPQTPLRRTNVVLILC